VITFSGIAGPIILLDETLSGLIWAGLAVIVVGLVIVGPQEEPEPELGPRRVTGNIDFKTALSTRE